MAEELDDFNPNLMNDELIGCSILRTTTSAEDNSLIYKTYKLCDPNKIKPPSLNLYSKDLFGLRATDNGNIMYDSYEKTTNNNICRTDALMGIELGNLYPSYLNQYSDDITDPECNRNPSYNLEEIKKIINEGIYPEEEQRRRDARTIVQGSLGSPVPPSIPSKIDCYNLRTQITTNGACQGEEPDYEVTQIYNYEPQIKCLNRLSGERTDGRCLNETDNKNTVTICKTTQKMIYNDGSEAGTNIFEGSCPDQFTNVKSERKSRKIERFESNNNLKCKHRY